MTARTAIMILLCSGAYSTKKRPVDCPRGMFQPNAQAPCQVCSSCPNDQITREACSQQHDTVCGPFKEFSLFQNAKMVNLNNNGVNEKQLSKVDSDDIRVDISGDVRNDAWNSTSLALISILSLTSVAFAGVMAILCYRCMKETRHGLLAEAETLGSEMERSQTQNYISGPWRKSVPNDYTNALPSGSRCNVTERSETLGNSSNT